LLSCSHTLTIRSFLLYLSQLTRGGQQVRARLAQLLTENSSPNPRWLIKFDGQHHKDEEVYEHTLGKKKLEVYPESPSKRGSSDSNNEDMGNDGANSQTSPSAESTDGKPASTHNKAITNIKATSKTTATTNIKIVPHQLSNSNNSSNEDDEEEESTSLPSGADEAAKEKARVSAREARSRRRQAKIVEEVKQPRRVGSGGGGGFKGSVSKGCINKRAREDGEECVKIPLLTGTLYLYRGRKKRRAEFIRRV
jgi:hypothetical protein